MFCNHGIRCTQVRCAVAADVVRSVMNAGSLTLRQGRGDVLHDRRLVHVDDGAVGLAGPGIEVPVFLSLRDSGQDGDTVGELQGLVTEAAVVVEGAGHVLHVKVDWVLVGLCLPGRGCGCSGAAQTAG